MTSKRINQKWTKPKCLEEAKKYKTAGDWMRACMSSWAWAQRNGLLAECTTHMVYIRTKKKKDETKN